MAPEAREFARAAENGEKPVTPQKAYAGPPGGDRYMATVDNERRRSTTGRPARLVYCGLFGFHRGPVETTGNQVCIRCKWCSKRVPAPTSIRSEWGHLDESSARWGE